MASYIEPKAQRTRADDLRDSFYLAEQALQRNDLKQSAALCQQLLNEQEDYAPAYYLLCEIYMQLKQHERALQFNDFALRFQPNSFDVYFQRGKILFVLGRWEEAKEAFTHANRIDPKNAVTVMLLGDVYAQQQDHAAAIEKFNQAAAMQDLPEIFEHKGLSEQIMGDDEAARLSFKALLKRLPNYAPAYAHLGKIEMALDEKEKAEEYFRKAEMLNPFQHEALVQLCCLCYDRNETEEAVGYARRALKINPQALEMNLLAIRPLVSGGFIDEAEAALYKLLEAHPDDLRVIIRLSNILAPRGKKQEALALVERALKQLPDNASLLHTKAALKGERTTVAPAEYVANTFDGYAEKFDYHLQELLEYHTPRLIADAVRPLMPVGMKNASLLDLGCGTGLAAEALRDITEMRVGVDLSPKMVEKSKSKGIYSKVVVDELVHFMSTDAERYNVIVAADVLVYIGELEPLFSQAAAHLTPGGCYAFSVEREESSEDYNLRPSARYAHSEAYIRRLAEVNNLAVAHCSVCDLRKEAGAMIAGTLFVLQAPAQ